MEQVVGTYIPGSLISNQLGRHPSTSLCSDLITA